MSIKYAVLGLIAEEPRHGYAVRAAFEERLGDFWDLNYGQIYQVLATLEQEGLITGADEQVGRRPRRTVYAITPRGRDALRRWLEQPLSRRVSFRDELYVRLLFVVQQEPALLKTVLADQTRRCEEHLASLVAQRDPTATQSSGDAVRHLFREAAILHAEADLQALQMCRTVLPRFEVKASDGAEQPRRQRTRA